MTAGRRGALALAALCALPGLSHAVTESEPLPMVFETSSEPAERPDGVPVVTPRLVRGCMLYLPAVEDVRSNKANAGNLTVMLPTVHATPRSVQSLRSGDATAWTRGALQSTRRYGFQPVLGAPASNGGAVQVTANGASGQVTADVALRLAHAWSAGLNLVSHVVLQVSYRLPGGATAVRQYHGMGTRTNFASGNGEFMSVLNLGLEEAVHSMALDAAALCDGKPLPEPAVAR
ncbi:MULTISPECIES: hypothetical protein [unclassified Variovorax]|uniref:hypothetical protein n=1 Tax=unclassified Variovorax TaxID=663243 RepID=UPI003F47750A